MTADYTIGLVPRGASRPRAARGVRGCFVMGNDSTTSNSSEAT